jgi:hypothetical protein
VSSEALHSSAAVQIVETFILNIILLYGLSTNKKILNQVYMIQADLKKCILTEADASPICRLLLRDLIPT